MSEKRIATERVETFGKKLLWIIVIGKKITVDHYNSLATNIRGFRGNKGAKTLLLTNFEFSRGIYAYFYKTAKSI